jgi:hypothetical protein
MLANMPHLYPTLFNIDKPEFLHALRASGSIKTLSVDVVVGNTVGRAFSIREFAEFVKENSGCVKMILRLLKPDVIKTTDAIVEDVKKNIEEQLIRRGIVTENWPRIMTGE